MWGGSIDNWPVSRIVGDLYENLWSSEIRHQPWSVTKTFIAATVGIAVKEGKVRSVKDPIEAYIPELKGTAWEGARIVDVLQMRSGVFDRRKESFRPCLGG